MARCDRAADLDLDFDLARARADIYRDQLPGAGKEWFSVQHWVAAEQDGVSAALVPVDAPLVCLGDIVRGTWPAKFTPRSGAIFSYVMNNYYFTNYAAGQGGDFNFRYVFTSGKEHCTCLSQPAGPGSDVAAGSGSNYLTR